MTFKALGGSTRYPTEYDPSVLERIERTDARKAMGFPSERVAGYDIWTVYEFSHLNADHGPVQGVLTLTIPATSSGMTESKSLKLYFFSLNGENMPTNVLLNRVKQDIETIVSTSIELRLIEELESISTRFDNFESIDSNYLVNTNFQYDPQLLKPVSISTNQRLMTASFRSLCPITNQPDWARIFVSIQGKLGVEPASLRQYLVGFRNHNEFHEPCADRIIADMHHLCPESDISVFARFTRRGGIDINPFRYIGSPDPIMLDMLEAAQSAALRDLRQ